MAHVRPPKLPREGREVFVRVPWSDPRLVDPEEFSLPPTGFEDLNSKFRAFLSSKAFLAELGNETSTTLRKLEAGKELAARDVWTFYRGVRLLAALQSLQTKRHRQFIADEFAHALLTGPQWYFANACARPQGGADAVELASANALGWVGVLFERWLRDHEILAELGAFERVVIGAREAGELPFAFLLLRLLRKKHRGVAVRVATGPGVDERLVATFAKAIGSPSVSKADAVEANDIWPRLDREMYAKARTFFKRAPERSLRIFWCPRVAAPESAHENLRTFLATCRSKGLPVTIDLVAAVDGTARQLRAGSFLFAMLDALVSERHAVAGVRVNLQSRSVAEDLVLALTSDRTLSELFRIQLEAELDSEHVLPDGVAVSRSAIEPKTALETSPYGRYESHFDLATVFERFGRYCGRVPHIFAQLGHLAQMPPIARAKEKVAFVIILGSATVIPDVERAELYIAAVNHFDKKGTVQSFLRRFDLEERDYANRLLERLLSWHALRRA